MACDIKESQTFEYWRIRVYPECYEGLIGKWYTAAFAPACHAWAVSTVVVFRIRIAKTGVQFPHGPLWYCGQVAELGVRFSLSPHSPLRGNF